MERRSFLRLGASAAVAAATSKVALGQNPHQNLINYRELTNGQYTGLVQFKPISNPGMWLGDGNGEASFPLTTSMTKWNMKRGGGTYNYHNNPRTLSGYWIYGSTAHPLMCWQAQDFGGSILKHWDWDHKADNGTPEDWELFTVETVDQTAQTVIIYNTAYAPRLTDLGAFNGNPPCYINLTGNNFRCDATKSNAVVLQVVFG